MADLEATCEACGQRSAVSEFADWSAVNCPRCGIRLTRPVPVDRPPAAEARLKIRGRQFTAGPEDRPQTAPHSRTAGNFRTPARTGLWNRWCIGPWTVFLLGAPVLTVVRYAGVLPPDVLQPLRDHGPWLVVAFHCAIVLYAFKDSVHQGILCLLVPFYSFFYLFFLSNAFYLRAVLGAVLAGLGRDSATFFLQRSVAVSDAVHRWIASGGG